MPNRHLLGFNAIIILTWFRINPLITYKHTYYILHGRYTREQDPSRFLGRGRKPFLDNKCKFKNCYVTKNEMYFSDKNKFDAIVFDLLDLKKISVQNDLPTYRYRNIHQKYIFTALDTDVNYPLCHPFLDNFFNWTWTYRLDSDFPRGFVTVYNSRDMVVGPKHGTKWPRAMRPVDAELKYKIKSKSQLAAWFFTDCQVKDHRRQFVKEVQEALYKLEGLTVDIFDGCQRFECAPNSQCSRLLKRNYFFYFVFEKSIAKDYVTEKLMIALDNYSVPVLYGGANYSMFLPPGSYLDARELGPGKLAHRMIQIKNNFSAFTDFFRWRSHFKYKDTTTADVCTLCKMMNHEKKMNRQSTKWDFTNWWSPGACEVK